MAEAHWYVVPVSYTHLDVYKRQGLDQSQRIFADKRRKMGKSRT